jgi:hypothetical protein
VFDGVPRQIGQSKRTPSQSRSGHLQHLLRHQFLLQRVRRGITRRGLKTPTSVALRLAANETTTRVVFRCPTPHLTSSHITHIPRTAYRRENPQDRSNIHFTLSSRALNPLLVYMQESRSTFPLPPSPPSTSPNAYLLAASKKLQCLPERR